MTTAKWMVFLLFRDHLKSWSAHGSMAKVMIIHSQFGFLVLSWVGWIHSCTEIMLLPLWIVAQQPRQIWVVFGIFREGFNSSFASSSVAEVVPHSKFGFLVFSLVGWIHSCTEIMLLPSRIVAQQPRKIG